MSTTSEYWGKVAKQLGLERKKLVSARKYWDAKGMDLLIPEDALIIGSDKETLQKAYIPLDVLKTHLHVVGVTGTGKSYFLECLMRDLMLKGFGVCLVDPHGTLYQNVLNFLCAFPKLAEKTVFFNPAEPKPYYVGFNPLRRSDYFKDVTVQVKFLTAGVAKVWEEDSKRTPLLRRVMGNMLYPLIEGGFTFLESEFFTDFDDSSPREKLVSHTSRRRVKKEWAAFEDYSLPRKKDELGSLQNRLPEFVDLEAVRKTIGRTENVLDFRDIVENQKILLCNLSQRHNLLGQDDSFMLGAMLVSELVNYAKSSRSKEDAEQKPYFLFVDEFQNFLTPDIGDILDECRKFGLHLVIAHQHLAQLKEKDPKLYSSVKANARSKVIFSCQWEDLEILVKDVFGAEFDLLKAKDEIYRTGIQDYEEEVKTVYSRATSSGKSAGTGFSELAGEVITPDGLMEVTRLSSSTSSLSSQSDFSGESEGISLVPFLRPVLAKELSSRQFYTLEEQEYIRIAEMKKQPTQHAVLKVLDESPQKIKITTIKTFPKDSEKQKMIENISYKHQNRYYLETKIIERMIDERQKKLENPEEDEDIKTFRV